MVDVSVIVPARNAAATLPRALAALAQQDFPGRYEVIVVDDGSTDGTAGLARRGPGPVTVLEQPATGPGAARNRGVAASRGAALAFCDADVYPTPDWLRAGVAALGAADLVQGRVLPDPEARLGPFDRSLWITFEVGLWETANLFVTRPTFDRVGGFQDWLIPPGGKGMAEDVLFGWTARRLGATSAFASSALAHHAVFPRGPLAYVAERRRLRYFPAMAARVPELRRHFFYRHVFLSRRAATFDLALSATAIALVRRSPLALVACLPYAYAALRRANRAGPGRLPVALIADAAADAVGLAALLRGSVRYRSPLG